MCYTNIYFKTLVSLFIVSNFFFFFKIIFLEVDFLKFLKEPEILKSGAGADCMMIQVVHVYGFIPTISPAYRLSLCKI